jgi:hypothetical protein
LFSNFGSRKLQVPALGKFHVNCVNMRFVYIHKLVLPKKICSTLLSKSSVQGANDFRSMRKCSIDDYDDYSSSKFLTKPNILSTKILFTIHGNKFPICLSLRKYYHKREVTKRFRSLIFEGVVVNPFGLSFNHAWWLYYDKISLKNLDLAKSDQLGFISNYPNGR